MEIMKGFSIVDLGLYLEEFDTLIFGDFHVGYEEMLNKKGVLIPRFQFKDIILRLDLIFEKFKKLKRIIVNGDLKHEFGTISNQEWRDSLKLLDYLGRKCEELVLVRGNHDTILGLIAKKRDLKIVDYFVLGEVLICHGDKIVETDKIKIIIVGHEHPAISIQEGPRVEVFKCFLRGRWERKKLIVMPSFNLLSEGTDVLRERFLSPYLKQDLGKFEVFVVGDKIYNFGLLKSLRK